MNKHKRKVGGYVHPRCQQNEELRCVNSCPPEKTCKNRDIQFSCLAVYEPCQFKCVCKEGYFRNSLGTCITKAQCDQCSGKNEFFACDSACDNECSSLHKQNRTNCPIKNIICNQRCYCENGYARDQKGHCIPVEKCPPAKTCKGPNEEYTDCKRTCPPETCLSLVAKFKCDSNEICKPGCACKSGFLRKNADSHCVPICECNEMKNSPDCCKNN
ncbi:unnamed protein product [Arctia plantaginis]|uniref:TIL domain-containing protein n=1 Tax=Arctia plantaginis TaxID=874455 RepID=A0A8S1A9R1_ARCPL|nr:unnamed protein product [Arctia plantaginis]CAB3243991.1 unnamed protein product [Arctia plantaginis]